MPLSITCSHFKVSHASPRGGLGLSAFSWQVLFWGLLLNCPCSTAHPTPTCPVTNRARSHRICLVSAPGSVLTQVCPQWKSLAGSALTFPVPKLVGGLGEQRTLPSSEKRVMQHEHPCQAAVFLDVSHSPITLTFYFCILLLTHADTDSLRTLWIPAQTEVTLLHPPFLPGDQAWAGHPVPLHGHGSAVEVPVTRPTGSPQFEEPAKLSNALHTAHLPAQLCLWQTSHANNRQQSDHKPRQAARPPLPLPHRQGTCGLALH